MTETDNKPRGFPKLQTRTKIALGLYIFIFGYTILYADTRIMGIIFVCAPFAMIFDYIVMPKKFELDIFTMLIFLISVSAAFYLVHLWIYSFTYNKDFGTTITSTILFLGSTVFSYKLLFTFDIVTVALRRVYLSAYIVVLYLLTLLLMWILAWAGVV